MARSSSAVAVTALSGSSGLLALVGLLGLFALSSLGCSDDGAGVRAAREAHARDNLKRIADETFPDHKHCRWNILRIEHHSDRILVDAAPTPSDVGYPKFRFLLHFDGDEQARCAAVYCFEKPRFVLLCTDPEWQGKVPTQIAAPPGK